MHRADTCKMKCLKELIEHVVFVGDLTQFTDLEAAEAGAGASSDSCCGCCQPNQLIKLAGPRCEVTRLIQKIRVEQEVFRQARDPSGRSTRNDDL